MLFIELVVYYVCLLTSGNGEVGARARVCVCVWGGVSCNSMHVNALVPGQLLGQSGRAVYIVAVGKDIQVLPPAVHVAGGIELRDDADTTCHCIFHHVAHVGVSVDVVGAVRAIDSHGREAGRLEGEGDGVHDVPVQDVELAVRHAVKVLLDGGYWVPVPGRVDHNRAECEARLVVDSCAVDKEAAFNELREGLEGIQCPKHSGRLDLDAWRVNDQGVTLVRVQRLDAVLVMHLAGTLEAPAGSAGSAG